MTIHRRDFLKSSLSLSVAATAAARPTADVVTFVPAPGQWRQFELTTRIEILKPQGAVRAWVPVPTVQASDWIRPLGDTFSGEGAKIAARQLAPSGAKAVCIEWPEGAPALAEVHSRVSTQDRAVDLSKSASPHGSARALSAADRRLYTAPTKLIPTDGLVLETSAKIVAGATGDLDKARRIYEWIVANTFRDPKVRGCGIGDISAMLKTGNLSGKCADLNALFVGLARAAGLPARDLYGIRVAPSRFGYKSLGAGSEIVTKSQHCRAEVYLSRFGWVPVDPADVRKVVLEEPPGNLSLDDPKVAAAHKTLLGAWEGNWIAFNDAHDVALPGAGGPPLGFLMYPQAETAAGRLDPLDPDQFKYTITAKEIA
jgi:transglutaminase-like putative cysteine protease